MNSHPQFACHSGERRWPPLSDSEGIVCGWTSGFPAAGLWTPRLWGSSGFLCRWRGRTATSSDSSQPPPDNIWWWLSTPDTKRQHTEQIRPTTNTVRLNKLLYRVSNTVTGKYKWMLVWFPPYYQQLEHIDSRPTVFLSEHCRCFPFYATSSVVVNSPILKSESPRKSQSLVRVQVIITCARVRVQVYDDRPFQVYFSLFSGSKIQRNCWKDFKISLT